MSRGKYLSLEEARNMGKLKRFAKEHPSQSDGRFQPLLEAVAKGKPADQKTSSRGVSGGYSGTQTPQDTSEGADD